MILTAGASEEMVTVVGPMIQGFRQNRGKTLTDLAEAAEMSPESLEDLEFHGTTQLHINIANRLARALGVTRLAICAEPYIASGEVHD